MRLALVAAQIGKARGLIASYMAKPDVNRPMHIAMQGRSASMPTENVSSAIMACQREVIRRTFSGKIELNIITLRSSVIICSPSIIVNTPTSRPRVVFSARACCLTD
jgi:hypothetical protein